MCTHLEVPFYFLVASHKRDKALEAKSRQQKRRQH